MAYDIRIWSREKLSSDQCGIVEHGERWLLRVACRGCVADDLRHMPDGLPFKPSFIIDIALEPIDSPSSAYAALEKNAKLLADCLGGVIESPMEGVEAGGLRLSAKSRNSIEQLQKRSAEKIAAFKKITAALNLELREAGYDIDTIRDLHKLADVRGALGIVMEHLARPYTRSVRAALAAALIRSDAKTAAYRILSLFRVECDPVVKDRLANAVLAFADDSLLEEIIPLVRNPSVGSSRHILFYALSLSKDPRALSALKELRDDPEFKNVSARGKHAPK